MYEGACFLTTRKQVSILPVEHNRPEGCIWPCRRQWKVPRIRHCGHGAGRKDTGAGGAVAVTFPGEVRRQVHVDTKSWLSYHLGRRGGRRVQSKAKAQTRARTHCPVTCLAWGQGSVTCIFSFVQEAAVAQTPGNPALSLVGYLSCLPGLRGLSRPNVKTHLPGHCDPRASTRRRTNLQNQCDNQSCDGGSSSV